MYDFYNICKCQKTKQIEQSFGRLEVKNYPQLGTQQHMTQQFSCLAQWNLNFERIKKNTIELNHFRSSPTPKKVLEPLYIYTHIYICKEIPIHSNPFLAQNPSETYVCHKASYHARALAKHPNTSCSSSS